MSGSYRKINYTIRPAKSVERKMLCDAFRKLNDFYAIDSYRYIGFGAVYFSDFVLFHRMLGIRNMVSIEGTQSEEVKRRFEFNAPYKYVELKFGNSWEVLPTLEWKDIPTILWLDYDGLLEGNCLRDIETFFSSATSGSVCIASFNIQDDPNSSSGSPLDRLQCQVGEENVPRDVDASELTGWDRAEVFRRIITNKIEEILSQRNGAMPAGSKLCYHQLFNFHYSDGALMLTVGGIIYGSGQKHLLDKCAFNNSNFCRDGSEPYKIKIPKLTFKEIRHLDSLMPIDAANYTSINIPPSEIAQYCEVYRYFPIFAESEI